MDQRLRDAVSRCPYRLLHSSVQDRFCGDSSLGQHQLNHTTLSLFIRRSIESNLREASALLERYLAAFPEEHLIVDEDSFLGADSSTEEERITAGMATDLPPTVFVEGTFDVLAQDFAGYLDGEKKDNAILNEITPLLEAGKKDDALKKLVTASSALNAAPEKEFTAAYNLLIYLLLQSPNANIYLQEVCKNLSRPITSSPQNGPGLALGVLSNLFNLLPIDNEYRSNVFRAILSLVRQSGSYDVLKPQLEGKLDLWLSEWDFDEEKKRRVFCEIADVAEEAGETEESYQYIIRALRTYNDAEDAEISSEEAQNLSIRALKSALLSTNHYDLEDLTSLPTVQALSDSHQEYAELLDIISKKDLEDFNDFNEQHEGFLEKNGLDTDKLHRKMRFLTLASLAASTPNRELEYTRISKALQIPAEDVEKWVIDVIRVGLLEGKLSQQRKMFLVHRTTYRVFGDKQWREVANKLDTWRESIKNILEVVRRERQMAEKAKDDENKASERRGNGGGQGMGAGRRYVGID